MVRFALVAIAIVIAACSGPTPIASPPARGEATASPEPKLWRTAAAPAGAPPGSEWIAIDAFDGKAILAAVIRPAGAGPWPVAVWLHGSAGMRPPDIENAAWLAKEGFVAVAPCWVKAGAVQTANLGCVVDTRRLGSPDPMVKDVLAVSEAARTLPMARRDRLVLLGHSSGAFAAVLAASTGGRASAVVSISGAYSQQNRPLSEFGQLIRENLDGLQSPLLIVHGTKDDVWVIEPAREYEKLAVERGKKVEALYVEGAPHALPYTPEFWTDAIRGRVIAFLKKHL